MSPVASHLLSALASVWPSPVRRQGKRMGGHTPRTAAYHRAYVVEQFMWRVRNGLGSSLDLEPFWGKDVLEVACGHGGITLYLAAMGARRAVGIDLNTEHMAVGLALADEIAAKNGRPLPVELLEMDATKTTFADASFDVVVADNCFEHFTDPAAVLHEIARVLRPGGTLVVPVFSSILSKYGLHLKHGLHLPWTNLVFSEETILDALRLRAAKDPSLFTVYPGLETARRAVDVRPHRDLNDITHEEFLRLANAEGFKVRSFAVHATLTGRALRKLAPRLERSRLFDVLSTGAGAVLERL